MLKQKKDKKRFFDKIDKEAGLPCWIWTAAKFPGGYGAISFGRNNTKYAHRVSYAYYKGEISEGQIVRHTCNNPSCVNPEHLVLGISKENAGDRKRSGTTAGHRHYRAKKRKFRIWNLRTKEEHTFFYQFEAAEWLGIHSSTIYRLLKKEGAKTVDGYQAEYLED